MPSTTASTQQIDQVVRVLTDRKARAEDESMGGLLTHLAGKRRGCR